MPSTRPPRRRPRPDRCAYTEGGRRCPHIGTGRPPLCDPHRVALEEAVESRSRSAGGAGAIEDLLRRVVSGKGVQRDKLADAAVRLAAEAFGAWAASSVRRPQSPPPPRQAPNIWDSIWQAQRRQQQQGSAPPPPPPPRADPQIAEINRARAVMGFEPGETLTPELVKQRRRALARKAHPDAGGSAARMAEINRAHDVLLDAVG